jgi:hypothetical protein
MVDDKPNAPENTGDPSEREDRGAERPSSNAALPGAEVHAPEANDEGRRLARDDSKHWLDYAVGTFAFIAAIGGVAAGIFSGLQAWVARDSEIVANRAFVLSNSVRFITYGARVDDPTGTGNANPRWIVTPIIQNIGNTPTRNMRFSSDAGMGGRMTAEAFDTKSPYKETFSPAVIGPRSEIISHTIRAGPNVLIQIQQGQANIGVDGVAKYQDIFGGYHLTEFCYNTQVPPIDFVNYPVGQSIRAEAIPCTKHNCSDDECGSDWLERAKK